MTKHEKTLEQQYRGLSRSAWWLGVTMLVAGPLIFAFSGVFVVAGLAGALHWIYVVLGVADMTLGGAMCLLGRDYIKTIAPEHERTAKRMEGLGW